MRDYLSNAITKVKLSKVCDRLFGEICCIQSSKPKGDLNGKSLFTTGGACK
jgi:hypothetical protein